MRLLLVGGLLVWGAACSLITGTTTTTTPACVVKATLSADAAIVGDLVMITGGPFTDASDTRVLVDGVAAEITVDRAQCDACDTCTATQTSCDCGDCAECASACADCLETVGFIVPTVSEGVQPVVLIDRHGATEVLFLTVSGGTSDSDTDTDAPVDTDVP